MSGFNPFDGRDDLLGYGAQITKARMSAAARLGSLDYANNLWERACNESKTLPITALDRYHQLVYEALGKKDT